MPTVVTVTASGTIGNGTLVDKARLLEVVNVTGADRVHFRFAADTGAASGTPDPVAGADDVYTLPAIAGEKIVIRPLSAAQVLRFKFLAATPTNTTVQVRPAAEE